MAIKGEGKTFELIRCDSSEGWLEQRKKGVGGSDVAAIMGFSKYKSPLTLWLEKTGREEAPDLSGKEAIEWGNRLESLVGAKYAENHPDRKVQRCNAVARSISRPWAQASLDYEVKDGDEWGILEIKTAGLRAAKDWEEGVPAYYLTQVTHYMSVLDRPFADVAVLIGGQEYREYRIERDADDIKAVNKAVDTFWNEYVLKDVAPRIIGAADEGEALTKLHSDPSDGIVDVKLSDIEDVDEMVGEYQRLNELAKGLESRKKEAANRIKELIGDSKGLETDAYRVTWVRQDRSYFDRKGFEKDHPGVLAGYQKQRKSDGGLRVKEV